MAFHEHTKGTGNISYRFNPGKAFQLEDVRLHLATTGGANSFTATLESLEGEEYNVVLNTQDMSSATDEYWQPTRPIYCRDGETILFEWTNASGYQWGLEIVWK